MAKVAIVTDSTTALPAHISEDAGLYTVPLSINWDGKSYLDGIEMTPQAFYEKLVNSKSFPTTSQASGESYNRVYKSLLKQGFDVLSITISSKISGTYDSAVQGMRGLPRGRIEVVDSLSASLPLGMVALKTARVARQGGTLLECRNEAIDLSRRIRVYFAVETLEYLHRGGRIGAAAKFLGTALGLKPILTLKNGFIEPIERVRTTKKAHARLIELTKAEVGPKGKIEYLGVVSAAAPTMRDAFLKEARRNFRVEEEITAELSPVIGSHIGPGAIGIIYLPAR